MQKKFFKNLLWLQALNWLIKPIWIFAIERVIQNAVGDDLYGKYYVVFNLSVLFAVLLDLGLNSYISREIAAAGRLIHKKRILGVRLAMALVYAALILIFGGFQKLIIPLLVIVMINQLMASALLTMRAVLQGRQRFVADSILSVTDRFIAIVVWSVIWGMSVYDQTANLQGNMSIVYLFVTAQSVGLILALITGAIWIRKTDNAVSPDIIEQRKKDGKAAHYLTEDTSFKDWAIHVFWFGLMAFAMSVFTRIDTSMIHSFSPEILGNSTFLNDGDFQAGLYAKSYRLLDAALIFSGLLSTQLLPMFTQKIASREDVKSVLKLGVGVVLSVSGGTALISYFFGNQILHLLYPNTPQTMISQLNDTVVQVGQILPFTFKILMTAFIPMALIHVFGTFVTALGQIKWLSFLAIICVGVNIAVNAILIPKYGAMGASVGCLVTQTVFALACIFKTITFLRETNQA